VGEVQVHCLPEVAREYYARPTAMTKTGRHLPRIHALPRDVATLVAIVQGLLLHDHLSPAYGVTLSDGTRAGVRIRPVEELLDLIVADDDRDLDVERAAKSRVAGNCRHFAVLLVAILRAHGTPARARCGFGSYFGDDFFEDHWVCEYWHPSEERWILVDPQIDGRHRKMFCIDFDPLDVPRDRFWVAGDAWNAWRFGPADPATFGLSLTREAGYWWIASNLMRDAAALIKIEMLAGDVWGAMPEPGQVLDAELAALFDHLATVTLTPDEALAELARLGRSDHRLCVPTSVSDSDIARFRKKAPV